MTYFDTHHDTNFGVYSKKIFEPIFRVIETSKYRRNIFIFVTKEISYTPFYYIMILTDLIAKGMVSGLTIKKTYLGSNFETLRFSIDDGGDADVHSSVRDDVGSVLQLMNLVKEYVTLEESHKRFITKAVAVMCRFYDNVFKNSSLIMNESNKRGFSTNIFSLLQLVEKGELEISKSDFKLIPSLEEGLSVFEFFSGIGGMHLALPKLVDGIPIKNITAFDCNDKVNQVYALNFPESKLKRVLIDKGLKLHVIDGKADIWTLSPPCQPYTKTRNAKRLDDKDNRSRGIFHLMYLLFQMSSRPRYIFLENVEGFLESQVLKIWKQVLLLCGYKWRQYLLSPIDQGIPNSRLRYYMIAKYHNVTSSSFFDNSDIVYR